MKLKNLLFTLCCAFAFNMQAQSYTFTATTATYTDLAGSTSLNGTATWDDPSYAIPIGFNFQYFNETISTIYINEIGVGAGLSSSPNVNGVISLLQAYGADIVDRGFDTATEQEESSGSLSNISYVLEGTTGNQILKIEWNNVGFFEEVQQNGAASTNFTNFQLWLFEADSSIEIHFGPNSITDPNLAFEGETGTFITLIEELDLQNETIGSSGAIVLTGSPSNPTVSTVTTLGDVPNSVLNGVIPNGTVYRFSNAALSINEFETTKLKLFPNPATGQITIAGLKQQEDYIIYNILGNKVMQGEMNTNTSINVEALSTGLYLLKFKNGNALKFTKR